MESTIKQPLLYETSYSSSSSSRKQPPLEFDPSPAINSSVSPPTPINSQQRAFRDDQSEGETTTSSSSPTGENSNNSSAEGITHPLLYGQDAGLNTSRSRKRRCRCCGLWNGCLLSKYQYAGLIIVTFIAVLVLIAVIIFAAIVPAVIRHTINESTLNVDSIIITSPTLTNATILSQMLIKGGNIAARVSGLDFTVSHVLDDGSLAPLGTLRTNDIVIDGLTTVSINNTFIVTNQTNFNLFVHDFVHDVNVTWQLESSVSITPRILGVWIFSYSGINFNKQTTLAACRGLPNPQITNFSLASSTPDSVNMIVDVAVINPSVFTMDDLGTLHLRAVYDGVYIGDLFSQNTSLAEGINLLHLEGNLASINTPEQQQAVDALISNYLGNKPSPLTAIVVNSTVPLFNAGITNLTLDSTLNGLTTSLVRSLLFDNLHLAPSSADQSVLIDANITVIIDSPLGTNSPLLLSSLSMVSNLKVLNESVGTMVISPTAVYPVYAKLSAPSNITDTFRIELVGIELQLSSNVSAYQSFIQLFTNETSVSVNLDSTSIVNGSFAAGNLTNIELALNTFTNVLALNGLNTVETSLNITGTQMCEPGENPCGVDIAIGASQYNPSTVTLDLGDIDLILSYESFELAHLNGSLSLVSGIQSQLISGLLLPTPAGYPSVSKFLSNFVNNIPTVVQLHGIAPANDSSAHALTVNALAVAAIATGQQCNLIEDISIDTFTLDFGMSPSSSTSNFVHSFRRRIIHPKPKVTYTYILSGEFNASFALPANLQLPLNISSTSIASNLLYDGSDIASLSIANATITHIHHTFPQPDLLLLSIQPSALTIVDFDQFSRFASQLLNSPLVAFNLDGTCNPNTTTAIGDLTLTDIPLASNLSLVGFNSFVGPDNSSLMQVLSFDVYNASHDVLQLSINARITNPTSVTLNNLGDVGFHLYYENALLGDLLIPDFSISAGVFAPQNVIASIPLTQNVTEKTALTNVMTNFIAQVDSSVTMVGASTQIPPFKLAVESFSTFSSMPGASSAFMQQFQIDTSAAVIERVILGPDPRYVPTVLLLQNPLSAFITLTQITCDIYVAYEGGFSLVGVLVSDSSFEPLLIPPGLSFSRSINATVFGPSVPLMAAFAELGLTGKTYLTSIGNVTSYITMSGAGNATSTGFEVFININATNVETVAMK